MRTFSTEVGTEYAGGGGRDRRNCTLTPGEYLCIVCGFGEPTASRKDGRSWMVITLDAIARDGERIPIQPAPDYFVEYSDEHGFAGNFTGEGRWRQFLDATKMTDAGDVPETEFYDAPVIMTVDTYNGRPSCKGLHEASDANIAIALDVVKERRR